MPTTPPPAPPTPFTIPSLVETATLAKFYLPGGEPSVVIKLMGVGNTAPFYLADKVSRTYVLRWDSREGGHIIRIPHSLWQAEDAKLAHDLMDQRRLPNAMIVTFELPGMRRAPEAVGESVTKPCAVRPRAESAGAAADNSINTPFSKKKGATEPREPACIVVGPGGGHRPVAPTLGGEDKASASPVAALAASHDAESFPVPSNCLEAYRGPAPVVLEEEEDLPAAKPKPLAEAVRAHVTTNAAEAGGGARKKAKAKK